MGENPNVTLDDLQNLLEAAGFRLRERSLWTLRAIHSARRITAEVEDEKDCGYRLRLTCVGRVYDFLPGDVHTANYILGDALQWEAMSTSGRSPGPDPDASDDDGERDR